MNTSKSLWIDITYPISNGMVHWPGDNDIVLTKLSDMQKGDDCNVTNISMSAHSGTHMDAPLHFIKEGKSMDEVSFEALIGSARIIEIKDPKKISKEELEPYNIQKGERILFKTANSQEDWTQKPFKDDFVYISTAAGEFLAEKEVLTIGIDYLSVGNNDNGAELHKILMSQEIWLIEGLDLRHVHPGIYEMICLPTKLSGADGAPVRALLKRKD